VSESNGVSVGVDSQKIVLFFSFEGPRREFGPRLSILYFVASLFSVSELPQGIFCKLNSLFFFFFAVPLREFRFNSDLAHGYLMIGEHQQNRKATNYKN
jgi:hypothetical protein